ncbi:MAG TPA: carboxypeptidase regulatory-like domain-containing protein [bacterium]|nr:carboxypeptidase regulatory-like domain-containing protein [bacterium]
MILRPRVLSLLLLALALALAGCAHADANPGRASATPTGRAPILVTSTAISAVVTSAGTFDLAGGTVEGRVLLEGNLPPVPKRVITVDRAVCGSDPREDRSLLLDAASHGVRYAAVTLTPHGPGIAAAPPAAGTHVAIEQSRCEFFPYITFIAPGGSVDAVNDDAALHDLHRLPPNGPGSHDPAPPGVTVPLLFAQEGRTKLVCDLHYWSSAWVIATSAPFAAVTDSTGRFRFRNVPPGKWTLNVWHERLGEKTIDVDVPSGEVVEETIGFTLPKPTPPGARPTATLP